MKSAVQYFSGDKEGAKKTQEVFTNECIGVSQIKSVVQLYQGDKLGAILTQAKFFNALKENFVSIINGTPGIGHAKAGLEYANGDTTEAFDTAKAASRIILLRLGSKFAGP